MSPKENKKVSAAVRILHQKRDASARAVHLMVKNDSLITYESGILGQAAIKKFFIATFLERKIMSTKTSFKRIALVAASALAIAGFSAVPANAANNTYGWCEVADGVAAGDASAPSATNNACNGVAGVANTVTLEFANAPATSRITIAGAAATFGTAGGVATRPSFDMKEDMSIVMFKTYNKGVSMGDYAATTTLAHELGHSFDLLHTYIGGGASAYCGKSADDPEYLSDVFGPWPGNCPHFAPDKIYPWGFNTASSTNDRKTNNMMGGFQSSRYFSPKQIGIMHRALTIKTVKRYVK